MKNYLYLKYKEKYSIKNITIEAFYIDYFYQTKTVYMK